MAEEKKMIEIDLSCSPRPAAAATDKKRKYEDDSVAAAAEKTDKKRKYEDDSVAAAAEKKAKANEDDAVTADTFDALSASASVAPGLTLLELEKEIKALKKSTECLDQMLSQMLSHFQPEC